jgi:hypothetical protein
LRLGIGVSFYQDKAGLIRLLDSVVHEVDLVIAVDGRYPSFGRGLPDLSTDGSREVCKSFDNVLLVDYPATQIKKRNKYLQLCKQHNIPLLCIMDSDEYIQEGADWSLFKHACEESVRLDEYQYRIYDVRYQNEMEWDLGERPRVWFKPWQMRYDVKHFRWIIRAKCKDRPVYEGHNGHRLLPGITIKHQRSIRPIERNKAMDDYEDRLMHLEIKQMRRKYNLP